MMKSDTYPLSRSAVHTAATAPPPVSAGRASRSCLLLWVMAIVLLTSTAQAQTLQGRDEALQRRQEELRQERERWLQAQLEEQREQLQAATNSTVDSLAVPEQDSLALVALYKATDGDNWKNTLAGDRSWLVGPVSEWYGVEVSTEGRVTWLNLYGNDLRGSIPAELSDLTSLGYLYLGGNHLSGSIPEALGRLPSLYYLNLSSNQLSGSIPAELGNLADLLHLILSDNRLSGSIPEALGRLSSLRSLNLDSNQLSGSIPAQLGDLTNLVLLYLHSNQLKGPIPAALGELTNLVELNLSSNQLSGSIPEALGRLSSLGSLNLDSNQLSGSIPEALGRLSSLTFLNFSGNQLSGSIPAELGSLTNLWFLSLGGNQLSGSIPRSLGHLEDLLGLDLSQNELNGPIPAELGQLSNLIHLWLHQNALSEAIPKELSSLAILQSLNLGVNQLSGSIPKELGDLTNLQSLYLWINNLSGSVPAELNDLANLRFLYLSSNLLDELPELSSLSSLSELRVEQNRLTFEDIEPNLNVAPTFTYAPQTKVDTAESKTVNEGASLVLGFTVGGASNLYQWHKDGNAISGATSDTYRIEAATPGDAGRYELQITNTRATDLTLWSEPVTVIVEQASTLTLASVEPVEEQTRDWGGEVLYTIKVVDEQGLVSGATVTVVDSLLTPVDTVEAGVTDESGEVTYTATVPPEKPDGTYSLSFRASKEVAEELVESEPVSRQVRVVHGVAEISLSADTLHFGIAILGAIREQSLTVTNTGNVLLQLSSFEITGRDEDEFVIISGGEAGRLDPSDQPREVVVRYTAGGEGVRTAALAIRSSLPDMSVALSATGVRGTITVEPPGQPPAGQDITVTATVTEGFTPTQRKLFHRLNGKRDYDSTEVHEENGRFTGQIPADVVGRGIDYYFSFSDGATILTYPEENPKQNPARIRTSLAQISAPGIFERFRYRMISAPYELQDPRAASVLEDDYGSYNPARWRLLRWSGEKGGWDEYPDIQAEFKPGAAFWLITNDDKGFNLGGGSAVLPDAPGTSVLAESTRVVTLGPGWNQIGNPYAFPIEWDSVIKDTEDVFGMPIYQFYSAADEQYVQEARTVLQPWEGYWIYTDASASTTLRFRPVEAGEAAERNALLASSPAGEPAMSLTEGEYVLQLVAELSGAGMRDRRNFLGLSARASEGHDERDMREVPGIGDYVNLSIVDEQDRYASSYKSSDGTGQRWDLEVSATIEGKLFSGGTRVQVSMLEHGQRPGGFQIYVLDRDLGAPVAVSEQAFSVELSKEHPIRHLRVIVGTEADADALREGIPLMPVIFALEQNYPNPFNTETVIAYQVSQRSLVTLDVYNVLGQRVRTLVQTHQEAGRYEVRWDGHGAASGIYFYRLQAGGNTAVKKMLLLR